VELELVESLPLLEWLANNYKSFGATLEIITDKSQEGAQFVRGFGGIGGDSLSVLNNRLSLAYFQGSHTFWKVLDFFLQNSRIWKVLEKHFGPGKSWVLKLKVLECPGKISLRITHFLLVLMENKQKQ